MTQQQIEGNKIIGEFMGGEINQIVKIYSGKVTHEYIVRLLPNLLPEDTNIENINTPEDLKYHSSWNWIIPAVNKFTKSAAPTDSWDNYKYKEYCDRLKKLVTDFNITPVLNCLSEAIKWYNQQH